jgi:outer membrane protein TolC
MRSRPEVLALKATAEARQADVHAAQGAYAPQVFGLGMVDSNASADGGGRTGYTVGIAATIPLYDGGAHSADIDAARAKAGRSQTDVAIMQQTIAQQVNTAWLQLQLEKDEVMSATAEVAAANEAYRLADLRYNAGKSTLSERLASLAERTRAAGALAQSKGDLLSAQAALLASIGKNQAPS